MLPDIDEALRYLGAGPHPPEELRRQAAAVAEELAAQVQPRYTYKLFPLAREEAGFRLVGTELLLSGQTAERMLAQCAHAVLLACTLGPGFDAMLRREQARDMGRAVMLDACGSAWVESGCDAAEEELRARLPGWFLTDRFSPGYGDWDLAAQRQVLDLLQAPKRIGLTLTAGGMLVPEKSITALVGLSDRQEESCGQKCMRCQKKNCAFRCAPAEAN